MSRELSRAIRRAKPDAREVYGGIEGGRFVARRANTGLIDAVMWDLLPPGTVHSLTQIGLGSVSGR